jgi:hypothetical protein
VNAARWPFLFRAPGPPDLSESVMALWRILRDVLLTGAGLVIIIKQALLTAHPSTEALIAGLALTGIGASFHVGALLSGHIGGPSSESQPPSSSSESGHSPGGDRG